MSLVRSATARKMAGECSLRSGCADFVVNEFVCLRTTGGGDATAVLVDNLADFTSAVGTSSPAVVLLFGAFTGSGRIEVGSHTTIIGLPGSCMP